MTIPAPLCKICGERHWHPPCPSFDTAKPKTRRDPPEEVQAAFQAMREIAKPRREVKAAPVVITPKTDRKAYMRDLMRKRRAQAKAKAHGG